MARYDDDDDEVTLRRASLRAAVYQVQTGLYMAQQQETGCGGGMQRNLSCAQLKQPAEAFQAACGGSQSAWSRGSRSLRLSKLRLTHLAGRASRIVPSPLGLVRDSGSHWCVRASHNEAASEAVVAQSCGIASTGEHNIYEALNDLLALVALKDEPKLRRRLKAHADTIMNGRGAVGETVLHMCFLCATAAHKTLATYLVDEFGKELIDAEYHGPEYHGEVALHIALVNKDVEAVRFLVGAGADTRAPRADGRFFRRREVYFGEYLLSFAAVLNLHAMVELIVAHGADVNAKDSRGNTALHMLVLDRTHHSRELSAAEGLGATVAAAVDGGDAAAGATTTTLGPSGKLPAQAEMYQLLVRLGAQQSILNRGLLSPLTMAAHQGKKKMFEFVLFEQRSVLWSYGPITLARYPLAEIESAGGNSATQRYLKPKRSRAVVRAPTALRLIVEKGHTELLLLPIVQRLLDDKWNGFVKKNIAAWFAIHMATLAAMVTHQLLVANQTDDTRRLIGEGFYWLSLVGATATGLNQLSQLQGESVYEFFLGTLSVDNFVSFLFMVALYASVPFYVTASDDWANFFLALASLLGSVYCLHFLRMLRHTGHLVVMVEKMIFDVLSWFNLVAVILLGFISAYFVLYAAPLQSYLTWDDAALAAVQEHLNTSGSGGASSGTSSRRALARASGSTVASDVTNFNNYGDTMLSLWRLTLGDIDYGVLRESQSNILAEALWIMFTLLFAVLLLNLLIAMMGFTFSRIADKAWVELQLQRAHIILEAERCYSFFPRKRPPHHVCDADGRWWCMMEDTHSAHYEYLSPPVAPDPDRPAYQLLGGGRPDVVARAVDDVHTARKCTTTMRTLRRAESHADAASTLGTATGAVPPSLAAACGAQDSTEQLLEELETVCA